MLAEVWNDAVYSDMTQRVRIFLLAHRREIRCGWGLFDHYRVIHRGEWPPSSIRNFLICWYNV